MFNKEMFKEACEVIREKVTLSDYLIKHQLMYGTDKDGMIKCPFPDHDDGTASFSYEDKKGLFNCFGCGRGGDVINLGYYMENIENERYSRIKAVMDISKEFKVTIPNMYENKFARGRVNKFQPIERGNENQDFYREKIKGLERGIRKMGNESKIELYRKIDDVLFERREAKEVFFEIREKMSHEGHKELL